MKKYYTLAIKVDGIWEAEFGDYDREVVKIELEDHFDHGVLKKNMKIITTGDKQDDIIRSIGKLNGELR